jgi:hypothetical protein
MQIARRTRKITERIFTGRGIALFIEEPSVEEKFNMVKQIITSGKYISQ